MNQLDKFKNDLAVNLYGMTTGEAISKGICINCKQIPVTYSEAGRREYFISGLCEPCFDEITKEK